MFKFIRGKVHHVNVERQKLQKELFSYKELLLHGFTHRPSSFAWDPKLNLIAIGTCAGFIRIYGTPGVEFYGQHEGECCVTNLFFIPNWGRLISLCEDNSLHLWEINTSDGESYLTEVKSYSLEERLKISSCCLLSHGQNLLIGTEEGNIYFLDVKAFEMTEDIIYQDVIMRNVSDDYKLNPGAVEGIAESPSNPNLILIGYNRGLMVLWDLNVLAADKIYTGSQQLESVTWYRDGTKFMSAHNDGSYILWTTADSSKPCENPKTPYGPFPCKSMNNILWLSVKEEEDFIIFSGGMPRASYGDRHTVTIMKGDSHQVLDFTSNLVDFIAITDTSTDAVFDNPQSLLVLLEEEFVVIDLETKGWPTFCLPYLSSLHISAITCTHHYSSPQDLWDRIVAAGNKQIKHQYSTRDWPVTGGKNLLEPPTEKELILTGHEDGTIRFWDASGVCLKHLYTLRTANLFEGEEHEASPVEEGEEWPPFRKIGNFDPYSDDPRLAVKKLVLCVMSGVLVMGGTAGQVIVFKIKDEPVEKEVEVFQVSIVEDRENFVWKGHDKLDIKGGQQKFEPGFQQVVIIQLKPPAGVTALQLHSDLGLVATGTSHGLELFDYVQKQHVLSMCTLNCNDLSAGDTSMTRRKSFKKSLRESFRRLRKRRFQEGKKDKTPPKSTCKSQKDASSTGVEVQSLEDQAKPVEHQIDDTSGSVESAGKSMERQVEARAADDTLGSIVQCLYIAKSFIVSCVTTNLTLWAGTNAGTVYIFTITMPDTKNRSSDAVNCRLVKEIQLKHRAPVVYIDIIDHNGYPLPDPLEAKKDVGKQPNTTGTHRVLICSEEQFKIFTLPSLKPYRKFKVTAHEGSHVRKVAMSRFTSVTDSSYSEYCIICLTNQGDISVYTVPDLHRQLVQACMKKENISGISSLMCTKNGQCFFLHSPSEFSRFTLSTTSVTKVRCILELPEGARPATETISQEIDVTELSPVVEKDKIEGKEEKHDGVNDNGALTDEEKKDLDITVDSIKDHLVNLSVEGNSFISVELAPCSKSIKTRETSTTVTSEIINHATVQAE